MFHRFPELGGDRLVASTDIDYIDAADPRDEQFALQVRQITQTRYAADGAGGYTSESWPPITFEYTQASIDPTVRAFDPELLKNLPGGADGSRYQFIDLDGEGAPGILSE